jgi:hypothetical protein
MVVTLVIVVLVLINTLYVAAEFSAVSVRRSRLEELARNGNRAARLLTTVIRDPAALVRRSRTDGQCCVLYPSKCRAVEGCPRRRSTASAPISTLMRKEGITPEHDRLAFSHVAAMDRPLEDFIDGAERAFMARI